MDSGNENRRRPGGFLYRVTAFLAVLLTAIMAILLFAVPLGSVTGNMDSVPGISEGIAEAADIAGPAIPIRTPDYGQENATGSTLAGGQQAMVRWDVDTGVPSFITGRITPPAAASQQDAALSFFDANKDVFRMNSAAAEFAFSRVEGDSLGMTHMHMAQVYQGIPVYAAGMAVHFNADGTIAAVNGRYVPEIKISIEPQVTADKAVSQTQETYGTEAAPSALEPSQLVVWAPGGQEAVLAWKITLAADDPPIRLISFIDAQTGKPVAAYDALEDAKSRKTYTANNGTSLPGTLLMSEGGSSSDSTAQNAHNNIGLTYDYYYNTFSRDSFNGGGAQLTSTVHYSTSYNNAFWNGSQMTYGDGDGSVFSPLGNALDVVAHELTHGVTQYSANLVYSYQSGALNESYSDVFGVMVDRDDWLMGEDVYTPGTPGDALRSMSNPTTYGQPDHMNSYVNTSSDNGGVHTNSGIPNKAAYNVATSIGKDKMEKIWYRTLTVYLDTSSQFVDARDASIQAATDLYGGSSAEVTAVNNGFAAVGIGSGGQSVTTARVEIDHTYRGDLVVTLGVGNPDSPTWSTTVSNRQGGSADNIYSTVDIAGGASYLPPSMQNRWFLKVYDAAGQDTGQISKFTITDHGTTYTATDVPIAVNDYTTGISYLPPSDSTPPTVSSTDPVALQTGIYASSNVTAVFSEAIDPATLTSSSFTLKRHSDGSAVSGSVTYDSGAHRAAFDPAADLAYETTYDATLTTAITDEAGNNLAQNQTWSFTTGQQPLAYYFTWYDMKSSGVYDWVVMGNPSTRPDAAGFDVSIAGTKMNLAPITANPGETEPVMFPGTRGGPIKVSSLDAKSQVVSKRTLFGDSFEEITAFAESRLDSHYYFTWYDQKSSDSLNWVLIANPGTSTVQADVFIGGNRMNPTPYSIAPGANVTPSYPGVRGGPVEVVAYEPGSPSVPRNVIASQRVLWSGNFNEVFGIPEKELTNDYLFTWYDQKSHGAMDWVLVANPDAGNDLVAEIWIAGNRMTNSATGNQYYEVPASGIITPQFPGKIGGPVEVRGYNASTYNPDSPGAPNMSFYTTQRVLFGASFGETVGYGTNRLSSDYHFSWYDQRSAGSLNWVLVSNPTVTEVKAEVWIAGTMMEVLTIAPGATKTPTYGGVLGGPVEVKGYDSATYSPGNPGAPNHNVFTSQRVLWNGHFNEVEGMVLP
ncbi:MAG: M4 family metallopeptidase [Thermoleophilia bacterium]